MFNNRSRGSTQSRLVGKNNSGKSMVTGGKLSFSDVTRMAQQYVVPIAKTILQSEQGKEITKKVVEKVAEKVNQQVEKKLGPNEQRTEAIKQASKIVQEKIGSGEDEKVLNDIMSKGINPRRMKRKKPIVKDEDVDKLIGSGLNITK